MMFVSGDEHYFSMYFYNVLPELAIRDYPENIVLRFSYFSLKNLTTNEAETSTSKQYYMYINIHSE